MRHHLREYARHGSNAAMAATLAAMLATQRLAPAWVLVGVLMLPFYEYLFHRFALHTPPSRLRWIRRLQDVLHYEHHRDLTRVDRYFAPVWVFVPLALGLYALYGALHWPAPALLFGNILGFMYYEWVHYVAHAPYVPRTRLGKFQKKYHMWHHHKNEAYWYGVTSPVVDMLAGTYKRVDQVPTSPTARRLHGE
jgi:hypothetical protein